MALWGIFNKNEYSRKGGGDGLQDVVPTASPDVHIVDPALEMSETVRLAEALNNAVKPSVLEMGSNGISDLTVMDGYLEATNDETGTTIRVVDPIISQAVRKPLDEIRWIIVQTNGDQSDGEESGPVFSVLDLRGYDQVDLYPNNPGMPYRQTHGQLKPAKNGSHMVECGPGGEPIPDADIPGQLMVYGPNQPAMTG